MKHLLIDWLYLIPTGVMIGGLVQRFMWFVTPPTQIPLDFINTFVPSVLVIALYAIILWFSRHSRLESILSQAENNNAKVKVYGIGMLESMALFIVMFGILFLLIAVPNGMI